MKIKKLNIYLAIFLPIQILLVQLASKNAEFIETYYSNGIYPIISKILRFLFGWIPFSFGDLLIALLLFLVIRFLVLLIKNRFRNFISKIIGLIASLSVIYFCFYLFWGLNYYRESLAKNLNIKKSNYTTEELIFVTKNMIKKTNEIHYLITNSDSLLIKSPYNHQEIYNKAIQGFTNLANCVIFTLTISVQ